MKDGSSIVSLHKNNCHLTIFRSGVYKIYYDDMDQLVNLNICVHTGKEQAGSATFIVTDDLLMAYCETVEVFPKHRRKRIATGMYVFAEIVLDMCLTNHWANDPEQKKGARKLWAMENRPFGCDKKT